MAIKSFNVNVNGGLKRYSAESLSIGCTNIQDEKSQSVFNYQNSFVIGNTLSHPSEKKLKISCIYSAESQKANAVLKFDNLDVVVPVEVDKHDDGYITLTDELIDNLSKMEELQTKFKIYFSLDRFFAKDQQVDRNSRLWEMLHRRHSDQVVTKKNTEILAILSEKLVDSGFFPINRRNPLSMACCACGKRIADWEKESHVEKYHKQITMAAKDKGCSLNYKMCTNPECDQYKDYNGVEKLKELNPDYFDLNLRHAEQLWYKFVQNDTNIINKELSDEQLINLLTNSFEKSIELEKAFSLEIDLNDEYRTMVDEYFNMLVLHVVALGMVKQRAIYDETKLTDFATKKKLNFQRILCDRYIVKSLLLHSGNRELQIGIKTAVSQEPSIAFPFHIVHYHIPEETDQAMEID